MGPRAPGQDLEAGRLVPGSDEDRRELEAALADEEGAVVLSAEDLQRWADTGECPESLR